MTRDSLPEGFQGSITAMLEPPYSKGSCEPVACPEHSTGPNVGKGCRCELGYHGQISAIREALDLLLLGCELRKRSPIGYELRTTGPTLPRQL